MRNIKPVRLPQGEKKKEKIKTISCSWDTRSPDIIKVDTFTDFSLTGQTNTYFWSVSFTNRFCVGKRELKTQVLLLFLTCAYGKEWTELTGLHCRVLKAGLWVRLSNTHYLCFQDLLAVGYGAFDFKEQKKGLACCWSLKNPRVTSSHFVFFRFFFTAFSCYTTSPLFITLPPFHKARPSPNPLAQTTHFWKTDENSWAQERWR